MEGVLYMYPFNALSPSTVRIYPHNTQIHDLQFSFPPHISGVQSLIDPTLHRLCQYHPCHYNWLQECL